MIKTPVLPTAYESEQTVLGIIFLQPAKFNVIQTRLSKDHFFSPQNKLIYRAMSYAFKKAIAIDYITISDLLNEYHLLSSVGGIEYLIDLGSGVLNFDHLDTYLNLMIETATKRKIICELQNLATTSYQELKTVPVDTYLQKITDTLKPFSTLLTTKNLLTFNQTASYLTTTPPRGLLTGFKSLDQALLGLQPGELIVIGARSGMGKSALMINIITRMAQSHPPIKMVVFSLAMSTHEITKRILSCATQIAYRKFHSLTELNAAEKAQIKQTHHQISQSQTLAFNDEATTSLKQLKNQCCELKSRNQLDLVVIDDLQLINTSQGGKGENTSTNLSQSLKQIARELQIPILVLSPIASHVDTRIDRRPMLADLSEVGTLEQDADVVMFLYRGDYYQKKSAIPNNRAELIIAKNRKGLRSTLYFKTQLDWMTFTE